MNNAYRENTVNSRTENIDTGKVVIFHIFVCSYR